MFRHLLVRLQTTNPAGGTVPTFPPPLDTAAKELFRRHPLVLTAYLEAYWNGRSKNLTEKVGHPERLSDEDAILTLPLPANEVLVPVVTEEKRVFLQWDHLIYAYMIENTRLYEVFRRVLHEYRHGEKLGTPIDSDTQFWLRSTEELFYSDPPPFTIGNVFSHVRADLRASRRNAYQRMFGMDLNHGGDDGRPYSYIRAEAANSTFVETLEELLREVWVGITNVENTSGAKQTDDSKIAELAEKLRDMLQSRRLGGNIAREEFAFVSMMAWFHLTLEFDSPIVKSLRADAIGVENRLFKIAERVGLPAHGLAKSFFDIADPLSRILIEIEKGFYSKPADAPALYDDVNVTNPIPGVMRTIITHWAAITGRDVKARRVTAS
jgi:hypothetical protein